MRQLGSALFGVLLAGSVQAAEAPTLEGLMEQLRQVRYASAHFVEVKTVRLLNQPLRTGGTLRYIAPATVEKVTIEPAPEVIRLDGDTLSGTRDGEAYTVDIGSHREIAALVEGIRSTLAGDLPTLQRYYTIGYASTEARWQMELLPKDKRVRDKVERIRVSGLGTVLDHIAVDETNGDRSEMTITPDPK